MINIMGKMKLTKHELDKKDEPKIVLYCACCHFSIREGDIFKRLPNGDGICEECSYFMPEGTIMTNEIAKLSDNNLRVMR